MTFFVEMFLQDETKKFYYKLAKVFRKRLFVSVFKDMSLLLVDGFPKGWLVWFFVNWILVYCT